MQRDASYVTGPVGSLTIAWTGQAEAHAGARQCMHWRFTNRSTPGSFSKRLTTVKTCCSVSRVCSNTFSPSAGGGSSLASAHAASQPRQPTQRVVSTRTPGPSRTPCPSAARASVVRRLAPAVAPAILKNPLRVTFMAGSVPIVRCLAGGDQVEGSDDNHANERNRECEHHGCSFTVEVSLPSASDALPLRTSASL